MPTVPVIWEKAMHRLVSMLLSGLIACTALIAPSLAQDGKLKKEELNQLLAPIALYPDDLLTNVLMASTYPLDVVQAARWRAEDANAKLKGDSLTKALEAKDWDPSVKALVQFPDVLKTMSEKLDWTQKLGDAFLAQQNEVMDEIQFLRAKADEAGNLKSNKQQNVVREASGSGAPIYIIEPASPEVVYVPAYDPNVVYGPWWYSDYPPYYWPYPGAHYVNGFFWGTGIAIAAGIWGWNHFDWRDRDIDIDVNKWNNINVNRAKITNGKWEHRPDRRGPVPYKNKDVRDKFKQADRRPVGNKDYRGFDNDAANRKQIEARLKDTEHSRVDDKTRDRTKDSSAKGKDKATARPNERDRTPSRDIKPAQVRKPSPGAFDVKRGADVRRDVQRGHSSRVEMRGGGGGRHSGGGRGGGRRR